MAKDNIKIIEESFDPKLVEALFKNFTDQYVALEELIDNAVDDMMLGRKLIIKISYSNDKLVITNYNGKGMGIEELIKFFRWGGSGKSRRIGRYGQGGKAALGYLAKCFSIKTHPSGSKEAYSIAIKNWEDREKGLKKVEIETYKTLDDEDNGSVCFVIENLKKVFREGTIINRIISTYRPLILKDQVEFIVNGDSVKCPPAEYDSGTKEIFTKSFRIKGEEYKINGEYGIVSNPDAPRGGIDVFQFGRKVAKKEYFGHIDPSKRWNVERLYGELYVDFEIPLLMNKTDIDRDSDIWQKIDDIMHSEITSIVKKAIDYKAPTKKEQNVIEKITKMVKKHENSEKFKLELANYGSHLLFKVRTSKDGVEIIINRDHKAYVKWSSTANGKNLYTIMIYSLYEATKSMSNKESAKLLNAFSESLKEHSMEFIQ